MIGSFERVLVVDDEENIRLMLSTVLAREGLEVQTAASGEEALEMLASSETDLLLSDIRMKGMSGLELLEVVQERHPTVVVIMMSAYGTVDTAIEAIQRGAYDYVSKPFKPIEAVIVIRKAEERERLKRENRQLRSDLVQIKTQSTKLGKMIARSQSMLRVFSTVKKISEYKTTVLIQGESGTGKELVARAIHDNSLRERGPFIPVNCGAIPDSLLESELFGHCKGAFTDATRDKKGLFTEADGGTLFLDEIGELPLALQVKILRALQEEEVRRIGDSKPTRVDARVVAATVRDLHEEVKAGRFREDLYYRLNVLPISLPPLRERSEDIRPLAEHFLERNNARLGLEIRSFEPEALKLLMSYDWPGNVRELENTIEHAMVLAEGTEIEVVNIPQKICDNADRIKRTLQSGELSIKKTTRLIEEELIRRALEQTGGNRTSASKILEISHRALLYKIKEYGI